MDPHPYPYPEAVPPRRRRWLIPTIVAGAILLFGSACAGAVLAAVWVFSVVRIPPVEQQPVAPGAAGSPVAEEPLECAGQCFTPDSLSGTVASENTFAQFGVGDYTFPVGTYDPATAGSLYREVAATWDSYGGTPDECVFALGNAPYAPALDESEADSTDPVYFMGTHEDPDRLNLIDQSVRVFPDSSSATQYMTALAASIAACSDITIGPERDRQTATITPAAAIPTPASVAAVGWVREGTPGPRWRAYVEDIQYGNLVVRVRFLTDGSINEYRFRYFAEDRAYQLSALPPAPPAG
ncbi:hypothetical protein BH09ACT5_BH09ACT5_20470 [soil metagenome]